MTINFKNGKDIPFGALDVGDVFKTLAGSKSLFMKMEDIDGQFNAVCLNDGSVTYEHSNTYVYYVQAEIVIE